MCNLQWNRRSDDHQPKVIWAPGIQRACLQNWAILALLFTVLSTVADLWLIWQLIISSLFGRWQNADWTGYYHTTFEPPGNLSKASVLHSEVAALCPNVSRCAKVCHYFVCSTLTPQHLLLFLGRSVSIPAELVWWRRVVQVLHTCHCS